MFKLSREYDSYVKAKDKAQNMLDSPERDLLLKDMDSYWRGMTWYERMVIRDHFRKDGNMILKGML